MTGARPTQRRWPGGDGGVAARGPRRTSGSRAATPPRRRRWRGAVTAVLGLVVLGVVAMLAVQRLVWPAFVGPPTCSFVNDKGNRFELTPDQARNAAAIVAVARKREMPDRAQVIGVATALQESRLINLPGGDRDSVGLFQQRPSQGWGTVAELRDPPTAAAKFYAGLEQVGGWEQLPLTVAAQAVQRSEFPRAYAQHEFQATVLAAALDGRAPEHVGCRLRDEQTSTTREAVAKALLAEAGITSDIDGDALVVRAQDAREAANAASWAVAAAGEYGVTRVQRGGKQWRRDPGDSALAWTDAEQDAALPDTQVRITLPST